MSSARTKGWGNLSLVTLLLQLRIKVFSKKKMCTESHSAFTNSSLCAHLIFPLQSLSVKKLVNPQWDLKGGKEWVISGFVSVCILVALERDGPHSLFSRNLPEQDFLPLRWIWWNSAKHLFLHHQSFLLLLSVSGKLSVKSLVNLSQGLGGY